MGEDLCRRPVRWRWRGQRRAAGSAPDSAVRILLWPWSKRFQMRCQVRSLRWQSAARMAASDAAGDGALEEPPQAAGGQAEPSDFVGAPDAESPPATAAGIAVAAKDPPGADRFSLGAAVVKAAQIAVPNQRADHLAVRTGRLLEPLRNARSIPRRCGKTIAPRPRRTLPPRKSLILPAWGRGGVVAGYEKNP